MAIKKPFRRVSRPFVDGNSSEGGRWKYLLHKKFAKEPQHYIRAFSILEYELDNLFNYIEPSDINLKTYSHRIQQLLTRICIEVEANLTAILKENGYFTKNHFTMRDYKLVNHSHLLSSYKVRIVNWTGEQAIRMPFSSWKNNGTLSWYKAYNESKHDRHSNFQLASFAVLTDAMCGLIALLSAQFQDESYSTVAKSLSIGSSYSYDTDDGMETSIGKLFRVKYPNDWASEDYYDFNWQKLNSLEDPFDNFDFSKFS